MLFFLLFSLILTLPAHASNIEVEWIPAPNWPADGYWQTVYVPDPFQRVRLKASALLDPSFSLADCEAMQDPQYPNQKVLHIFLSSQFSGGMCDPATHPFWHADYPAGICKQAGNQVRINFHMLLPAYPKDANDPAINPTLPLRFVPGPDGSPFLGQGPAASRLKWLGLKFPTTPGSTLLFPVVYHTDTDWNFDEKGNIFHEPITWDCQATMP